MYYLIHPKMVKYKYALSEIELKATWYPCFRIVSLSFKTICKNLFSDDISSHQWGKGHGIFFHAHILGSSIRVLFDTQFFDSPLRRTTCLR